MHLRSFLCSYVLKKTSTIVVPALQQNVNLLPAQVICRIAPFFQRDKTAVGFFVKNCLQPYSINILIIRVLSI